MVVQENVTMVVTTCNLKEGARDKCAQFWPDSVQDEVRRLDSDMSVTAVSS